MSYVKRDWDTTGNEVTKEDFKRIEKGIENNDKQINVLSCLKIKEGDRDINTRPSDYLSKLSTCVLKSASAVGLSKYGSFANILGYNAWHDNTAKPHEIAFINGNILYRTNIEDSDAWGDWVLVCSGNYRYTSYSTDNLKEGKWYSKHEQNPTDDFYYIDHYDNPVDGYAYQTAISPFSGDRYERIKNNHTWYPWRKIMTQTQVQALIDANIDKPFNKYNYTVLF